jgi:hypothetical protein
MSQRYAFIAEWLDPNSGVLWRYQLFYYKDTNELEMVSDEGLVYCCKTWHEIHRKLAPNGFSRKCNEYYDTVGSVDALQSDSKPGFCPDSLASLDV